jgi:hypothetical protein
MATSAPPADGDLADEWRRLLAQKTPRPARIAVHAAVPAAQLARWSAATGARFVAFAPWSWPASAPAAFATAIDLQQGDFAPAMPSRPRGGRRLWRPALVLLAAALGIHLFATLGEWASLRLDARSGSRAWQTLATGAGIAVDDTADGGSARVALLRRFSELRHANGLAAPGDPLPLLARAAPALAQLPRGAVKSVTFSAGAWTVEFGTVDADALREFDAGMRAAGLPTLVARTNAGTRARFGGPGP